MSRNVARIFRTRRDRNRHPPSRVRAGIPPTSVRSACPRGRQAPRYIFARASARTKLQAALGPPFVIGGQAGAGSIVGTGQVAKEPGGTATRFLHDVEHAHV